MATPDPSPVGTSWPAATWVAPVVPTLSLLTLVLADSSLDLDGESDGYGTGLGVTLGLVLLGLLLGLVPSRVVRGLGVGLATGGAVTALGWLVVLVR